MEDHEPILITGCARSGTSIVGGIVHFCGAWGGIMTGPTPHNKKGQFENQAIRNELTKKSLSKAGFDPLGQKPLPNPATWKIDPLWRQKVFTVIRNQGYRGGPWFYKGAKMCLVWTQWADAFPNAKWIIVRRDPARIISSCLRTRFMRAYNDEAGWQKWVNVHLKRFQEMKDAGLNLVEVWPNKIIAGNYGEIKRVVSHLGLEWNREVVHNFVTPSLWSGRDKIDDVPCVDEEEE